MKPRDGTIHANGLTAEFRFIRCCATDPTLSRIETSTGESWERDSTLTYDPPETSEQELRQEMADAMDCSNDPTATTHVASCRDLTPEAAAAVEKELP